MQFITSTLEKCDMMNKHYDSSYNYASLIVILVNSSITPINSAVINTFELIVLTKRAFQITRTLIIT